MVARCIKAEFVKCRHSALLYLHILVPLLGAVVFAGYFRISGWDVQTNISAYLEVLAAAFPFLIGIIVGMVVGLENQAGHWQTMLGTIPSRPAAYIGKLSFLMLGAAGATALALGCFAAIYREAPLTLYLKAWILLVLAVFPLYLIHLFVGMRFGKGASMGLGIAGSLVAALMITGLGDTVWSYIPWAWGVRFMDYTVLSWSNPDVFQMVSHDFIIGIVIALLSSLLLFFFSIIWFRSWEGSRDAD